ncbi:MAG: hypothetical protein KAU50_06860 [Candidatus Marinimicrobia bacterium]|nr:hypothetical protein [Candidatus Neomarinimicrobiota bacterium]
MSKNPQEKAALVRSLILPGWGQQHLGATRAARKFLLTEGLLWLSHFTFKTGAGTYEQDYQAYAAEHAGVAMVDRPAIYYYHVGAYNSLDDYNAEQLRQRNIGDVYDVGENLEWQWDSGANREEYVDLRRTSLQLGKAATFATGGLIFNRAVAAINVLFLSRRGISAASIVAPNSSGARLILSFNF